MAPRRPQVAFLLTAFAVLALLAAPSASAAAADVPSTGTSDTATCTPAGLVQVCIWTLDCITVTVVGQPFATIGCS